MMRINEKTGYDCDDDIFFQIPCENDCAPTIVGFHIIYDNTDMNHSHEYVTLDTNLMEKVVGRIATKMNVADTITVVRRAWHVEHQKGYYPIFRTCKHGIAHDTADTGCLKCLLENDDI